MFTKPRALLARIRGRMRHLLVAKVAAAVTVTACLVAVAGPAAAVSLAGVQNLPEIAAEGIGNSLDYYYYQSSPGTWHEQQVAGPGTTYSAPSLTQIGGTKVIAVEGPSNSLRYYVQYYPSSTWQEQQVAAPGTTFSAPSVTEVDSANGSWGIAAEGPGNSLYYYHQYFITWLAQQVAGPGTTYSAPSLAETNLGLGIAAEGSGNSLDLYAQGTSGGWTPQQVAAGGTTYSAPSLAQLLAATGIAAEGPSNSLMYYSRTNGTKTWQSQQVAAGPNSTHSAPSLAQLAVPAGKFTLAYAAIAVEGPVGFLDLYTRGPVSTSPWQLSVPGNWNSSWSAPSLAQIDGTTGIAVQGFNHSLSYYNQPTLGSTWNLQHVAGAGTTFG